MNQCHSCYDAFLSNCPTGITVNAGLTPGDSYKWQITDKFGNVYQNTVVADVYTGEIVIASTDLPDGFLTAFNGDFKLQILDPLTNIAVAMKLCAYYDCISVSIVGGNDVQETIGV